MLLPAMTANREADMAKLVYSAITSLNGHVADEAGNFDWPHRTRRCTPSSTNWNGRSAAMSTDGACKR
jgi:hypothetical protein